MKMTNKMQLCRIIYCSLTALHVSSDIFAHHHVHIQPRYQPATTHENNTRSRTYSLDAPDDERKYRSKPVEQPRNNKLSYTVASWGKQWRSWLRHFATSRKVAGSIPDGVIGFFN